MRKVGLVLVCLVGLGLGITASLLTAGPWGPSGCPVGAETTKSVTVPSFQANLDGWYTFPSVSTWEYHYEKGWLVEAKDPSTGEVQRWDRLRRVWERLVGPKADMENFGIDLEQMKKPRPSYIVSGAACSRDDLRELLDTPDGLPNDKDKPWLIAVGDDNYLKQVAGDVEKSALRQLVRFQGLKTESFHAKKFNLGGYEPFVRSGRALLVVLPDEKVVHLQTDYQGPKDIKELEEALDPAKIPDIRKPTPSNPLDWSLVEALWNKFLTKVEEEPVVWLVGVIVLVLLLRKPKQ